MLTIRITRVAWMLLAATACCCCLDQSSAWGQYSAPAGVNPASVRTTYGHSAYARPSVSRARSLNYEGGFFHFQPGQALRREQMQQAIRHGEMAQRANSSAISPTDHSVVVHEEVQISDVSADDVPNPGEPIPQDALIVPGEIADGFCCDGCGGKGCGGKGCDGKGCGGKGCGSEFNWFCFCIPLPPDDNLSVNFGVHGFKDPLNFGLDNSFGFHEGFNLGFRMPYTGLGMQAGLQGVHSNFSGAGIDFYDGTFDDRSQVFFTGGVFHRVDCGLQGGVVLDYMKDDWHYNIELAQLRGELGWVRCDCHEFGVFFHVAVNDDVGYSPVLDRAFGEPGNFLADGTDLFAIYFRQYFDDCGTSYARMYLGVTGEREYISSDSNDGSAVFGADIHIGLHEKLALETGFIFVTSSENNLDAAQEENWNVGFNLVWYPHGVRADTSRRYYRPLFNVADNGSFLVQATN